MSGTQVQGDLRVVDATESRNDIGRTSFAEPVSTTARRWVLAECCWRAVCVCT